MNPPTAISVSPAALSAGRTSPQLPIGTFSGLVIQTADGLAVRAGAVRIPLPAQAPFVAGQPVEIRRASVESPVEVRAVVSEGGSTVREGRLAEAIAKALARIGAVSSRAPESIVPVLPRGVPLTESQVRQVLALFAIRGALGPDFAAIASHVRSVIALGWIAPEWVSLFLGLADVEDGQKPEALAAWLRRAVRAAAQSPERALATGTSERAAESLLVQARLLRNDPEFRAMLKRLGEETAFVRRADALIDRLEGRQLHQLHGLESSYVFVELPLPMGEASDAMQLHWFRGRGRNDAEPDVVALDLTLSQLGALWITLHASGEHCRCALKVTEAVALHSLEADSGSLEDALRGAGYAQASVRMELWDGDRLDEVMRLLSRNSGLDLQA